MQSLALEPYQPGLEKMDVSSAKSTQKKSQDRPNTASLGIDRGLCIFKPQQFEAGIKREVVVDYHALASIQKNKCIEFIIPKSNTLYFALNKSVLRIKFRILCEDGTAPAATDRVTSCNAAGISLFRAVDIELQQKLISPEISTHYCFKGYFDYVIYTPEEYLNSGAQTNLFFKDTPYAFSKTELDGKGANTGLIARHEYTRAGAEVYVISPIAHDLMQVQEYLPNEIEIKLRFWPNTDEFFIISGESSERYKYVVEDCILEMHGYEPSDNVLMRHNQILSKSNAQFHYKRSVLKSYQIPPNLQTWTIFQFLQNEVPSDLVITFIDAENFVGSQSTNPYECAHNHVNFLSLETEGYQTMTFRPDYSSGHYAKEYSSLYQPEHGMIYSMAPLVKYRDFAGGYAFYRFPLGNQEVERLMRHRKGQSRLVINFAKKIERALTVLVYARFHAFFMLDAQRNIYLQHEC